MHILTGDDEQRLGTHNGNNIFLITLLKLAKFGAQNHSHVNLIFLKLSWKQCVEFCVKNIERFLRYQPGWTDLNLLKGKICRINAFT